MQETEELIIGYRNYQGVIVVIIIIIYYFFFQAEDGIRDVRT